MIVRVEPSAQLLIAQPDHAALAASIMRAWRADGLPDSPRRADILLAVEQHDNGWREVDAAPIVDSGGGLLDFIRAPDDVRRGVWPRGVKRLSATPYAAALVAEHALAIFERYRRDPEWEPFFAEMTAERDCHLRCVPGASLQQLVDDYRFVLTGDLISLVFCNRWQGTYTGHDSYRMVLEDDVVTVTPDPFGGGTIPFEVPAVAVAVGPFPSALDAAGAFRRGERRVLTGIARGERPSP